MAEYKCEKTGVRGKHKKGTLIIRNLSFKVKENILKEEFSKFGNIIDIRIPKKPDGKMRGFGFVEYEKTASAIKAINALNSKEFLGRPVAIDFALAKNKYNELISKQNMTENEETSFEDHTKQYNLEEQSKYLKRTHKLGDSVEYQSVSSEEESFEKETKQESEEVSEDSSSEKSEEVSEENEGISEDSSDENESSDSEEETEEEVEEVNTPPKKKLKIEKPQRPSDIQEGRTLFIRNLSFDSSADNLKEALSKFGPIKYCLLCIDKLTDYPKGTAFVQFENKDDAEKCLEETIDPDNNIVLDGRKLVLNLALRPEEIEKNKEDMKKKPKDNRNLKLLTEGLVRAGSDAAKGVSQADIKTRLQLEAYKMKLLKNTNYFISPVRLCVHNLPLHIDDRKLKMLFLKAAGPQANVPYAKVMRNLKDLDAKGVGISKGFGFVAFTKHEDALQALRKLNNNPDIFTPNKRPIVEFSIENMQILNAKKHQIERQQGKKHFFASNKKKKESFTNITKFKKQEESSTTRKYKKISRKNMKNSKQKLKKGKMKKMKQKNFNRRKKPS